MTRLMLTVATTALVPALALAESHATGGTMDPATDPAPMMSDMTKDADALAPTGPNMAHTGHSIGLMASAKASVIIGSPIYTLSAGTEVDWDPAVDYDDVADEWARIGSVDDIVLSEDGKISGLVAEVGGFLGLGDTLVLLPLDDTRMVAVDGSSYAVVTPFTSEQLTEMEKVE